MNITVRFASIEDRDWVATTLRNRWGSTFVVSRGVGHDASVLPALVALVEGRPGGLLTYRIDGTGLEVVSLDSLRPGRGVGSVLLAKAGEVATAAGCDRLWLITSNDNLDALRFYQRRGLRLVAVHAGAIDAARRKKPSIPLLGHHGIPVHDELELAVPTVATPPTGT